MVPLSQMEEIIHALLSVDYHVDAEMPLCEYAFRANRLCICSAEMSVVKRMQDLLRHELWPLQQHFQRRKLRVIETGAKRPYAICLFLSSLLLFHQ